MARRLILDTGVLVASERRGTDLRSVISEDDDVVLAAITVAELRTGIELAGKDHRQARERFVARLLQTVPVEPYNVETAQAHARLLAHVHRSGAPRGAHDLIVAATSVTTRRTILTSDRNARFEDLPGVYCVIVA